jgi:hypothetical protein
MHNGKMPLSEFLSRVRSADGEVRVYQHDRSGAFYAMGERLGEEAIRYDASEDRITTVETDSIDDALLVRIPELEESTNK